MADLAAKRKRPIWFNVSPLNLPAPGLLSILHRVSGAWLFLGLVWFLFLLEMSLGSEAGFERARAYVSHPIVKLALLTYLWSYLHHFCAGIRYLLLDIDIGMPLASARRSAFLVFAVSLALTIVIGVRLW